MRGKRYPEQEFWSTHATEEELDTVSLVTSDEYCGRQPGHLRISAMHEPSELAVRTGHDDDDLEVEGAREELRERPPWLPTGRRASDGSSGEDDPLHVNPRRGPRGGDPSSIRGSARPHVALGSVSG